MEYEHNQNVADGDAGQYDAEDIIANTHFPQRNDAEGEIENNMPDSSPPRLHICSSVSCTTFYTISR